MSEFKFNSYTLPTVLLRKNNWFSSFSLWPAQQW